MARDETIKLSLIDGVTKNLTAIRDGVTGVGASLVKLNSAAELAGKGFALIGSAVSSIGNAVTEAANLEVAMSRVADITQATAEEQVALQAAVQSAVSTVGVSADQAAAALVLMAEDGFSASEAIGSLNTVLSFAKANAQDAATATQALGGVLDTFGEKPAIIAQLADQLTAASRAAGVGTNVLQQGLAAVGVQASQAGLSVGDAVAALAALADSGIEGTQAAKQLGNILRDLDDSTSLAGKALDEAGLKGKTFAEVINALSNDSAKAAKVTEGFAGKTQDAFKALLKDGGGALREFTGVVNEAGNASAEAAAKVDETFVGALARFQASIGNLRNEFLKPILAPLADEFTALSEKINSLAASPEFARIRTQFEEFATGVIRSIGNLIENVNFEELTGDIADFGEGSKRVFDDVILVAQSTAEAIRGISFAIKFLRGDAGLFSDSMDEASAGAERLGDAAASAGKSISSLSPNLDKGSKSTRGFAADAFDAADKFKAFASSIIDAGRAAAIAAGEVAIISNPAAEAREELVRLSGGAEQAAIGLERFRLQALVAAQAALGLAGGGGTAQFQALTAEIGRTEAQIAAMQAAIDKATQSNQQQTQSVEDLRVALQQLQLQQQQVDQGNQKIASSNSQVSEEFGNIGKAAKAAKADMGNMSKALLDLAIEMQSQARSGREIIEIWKGITDQYNQSNERIEYAIALRRRQLGVMDEEQRVREKLQQQYGTDSTLLEELVQIELKRLQLTKERIAEEQRGLDIEKERLGLAGGFGASRASTEAGTSAAAGKTGGEVTVNISGLPADQAGWNEAVSRFILPAIERVQRLAR